MAYPFLWSSVHKLVRRWATAALLLVVTSIPAVAQHRLCDPANEDCRDILISHIRAETVRLDVAFWFMEDPWMAQEVINRWRAGVPVRILVDTEANATNPRNALRLSEFEAAGIPMRERVASGILHWKMMLFAGQGLVQFSGANYSSDAWLPQTATHYENYIDEAILFTTEASIVNSFKTKYDDLWTNTSSYANYRNVVGPLTRAYPTFPIDPRLNFVPDESYFWRTQPEYRAETLGIDVVMYRITDWRFSEEMIQARQRGVPVRLLTEPQQYRDVRRLWHSYNVDLLYMYGVEIKHRVHAGLNHQKSVILRGLNKVIFGSSNWSSASAEYQEEHNLLTTDPFTVNWFEDQFDRKWGNLAGVAEYGPFVPLPPDAAKTPAPATGAQGLPTSGVILQWDGGPWAHRYDVYLGTHQAEMVLVGNDLALGPSQWEGDMKSFEIATTLLPGTTYFWKIVARTMANQTASSPTWTFKTAGIAPAPPAVTLVRHPYLQQVTSNSAIVAWTTRENGPAKVRYAPTGGDVLSTPAVTTEFLPATTGMAQVYYQHVARLTGLSPATTYTYDILVSDRDLNPTVDRLTTAPAPGTGTVRFVAFGDSGTGSAEQTQLAARLAADTFDLAVHGGDLAYGSATGVGGATYQTTEDWFFTMYRSWLRARPVFPSLGNHDSRASNSNGRPYLDMFVLPEMGASPGFPDHAERYYSFDYGPVHFVVLDTELAFQGPDLSRRNAQLAWLDADLAATTQPWKVAVFHRSPYSAGGEHGSDLAVRDAFGPIFDARGVQLVISAHEHDYERTVPLRAGAANAQGVTYVVTGGGGAPLYPAGTASWTAHSASVHHYVKATATACTLRLDAIDINGAVFDGVTLRRCDPSISSVANQAIAEDSTTGALPFTVGDPDTPLDSLSVTATSSNAALVPNGNIVLAGSGANRTATITPAANQFGTTTITLRVSDGVAEASTSFTLTVASVNDPPTITSIVNQTIRRDESTGALAFTVGDVETAAGALTLSGSSSNAMVVPNGNIVFGGSGSSRTVTVTPAAGQTGTAAITLTVSDGTTATTTSFTVNVVVNPAAAGERIAFGLGPYADGGWISARKSRDEGFGPAPWTRLPWADYNVRGKGTRVAAGDVDGDGRDELIVGVESGGAGWVAVLDDAANNHALLKWIQVPWPAYNQANGEVWPAAGDLDGDGRAEIVLGLGRGGAGFFAIFDDAQAGYAFTTWRSVGWAPYNAADGSARPAIANLDGVGAAEIVIGLGPGGGGFLQVFSDAAGGFAARTWVRIPWQDYATGNGETYPAAGDLDADGRAEIVVGLGPTGQGWLFIFDDAATGFASGGWRRVSWPAYAGDLANGETHPAVGNVDGDAAAEIVIGLGRAAGQGGRFEVLDDSLNANQSLGWFDVGWAAFSQSGGALFPAVGRFR